MTNKRWLQSKTVLFNLLVALLMVLSEQSELVRSVVADEVGYNRVMLVIAMGNTYLRLISSTAINWKKPRIRSPTK